MNMAGEDNGARLGAARTKIPLVFYLLLIGIQITSQSRADEPKAPAPQAIPIRDVKRRSPVDFQGEILPMLKANCLACHNQTATKAELILETPQTIRKGGESGPAVVPGKPGESLLLQMASHQKRPLMPPKENKVAASDLKPEELGLIKLWIEQGAKGEVRANIPVQWRALPKTIHPIYSVAVTRDGQFAACGRGNRISIYHLPSRQLVTQLADPKVEKDPEAAHSDLVQSLDFSPDGTLLASGAFREVKLWRRFSDSKRIQLTATPSNAVFDLAPDGRSTAIAVGTNQIVIRDVVSGAERQKFTSIGISPALLKFSPDSTRLASFSSDHQLEIWNAREGKLVSQTNLSTNINHIAWTGGNQLATAGQEIDLWQLSSAPTQSMMLVKALAGQSGPVTAFAASTNSLVSAQADGKVRIWDLEKATTVGELKQDASVTALAVSSDGKRIATAGSNNVVRLWSPDGHQIAELKGDRYANEDLEAAERKLILATNDVRFRKTAVQSTESARSNQVARVSKATATNEVVEKLFLEKQKSLASAAEARTTAEKLVAELRSQLAKIPTASDTNSTNAIVATQSKTNTGQVATNSLVSTNSLASTNSPASTNSVDLKLVAELKEKLKKAEEKVAGASNTWAGAEKDFKKAELTKSIAAHEFELATGALEKSAQSVSEAKTLLQKSEDKEKQRRARVESLKNRASSFDTVVRMLAFSPDNRVLASAGDDSALHTWSAESGAAFDVYRARSNAALRCIAFNSVKRVEAAAPESIFQWNMQPGWRLERTLGKSGGDSLFADRVNAVRFDAAGRLLATGGGEPSRSGEIKVWTVADGKLSRDLPSIHSDTVFSLDFSPDSKLLASGGADKFLRVSSLESGKLLKSFEGHTHHVLGVSWNQDGRTIASAGADALAKSWNAATAERLKNIDGFGKEVTSVSFIGVTDQVLASAGDGQLRLVRETGETVRSFAGASDYLYSAAATPDGKIVLAGGQDGVLRVWDGRDGKPIAEFAP